MKKSLLLTLLISCLFATCAPPVPPPNTCGTLSSQVLCVNGERMSNLLPVWTGNTNEFVIRIHGYGEATSSESYFGTYFVLQPLTGDTIPVPGNYTAVASNYAGPPLTNPWFRSSQSAYTAPNGFTSHFMTMDVSQTNTFNISAYNAANKTISGNFDGWFKFDMTTDPVESYEVHIVFDELPYYEF